MRRGLRAFPTNSLLYRNNLRYDEVSRPSSPNPVWRSATAGPAKVHKCSASRPSVGRMFIEKLRGNRDSYRNIPQRHSLLLADGGYQN